MNNLDSENGYKNAVKEIEDGKNEIGNFPRHCDECGAGMTEGYCVGGGCEYYCSDSCLHKHYTPEEWEEMYEDGGDNYWTEWEENDIEE